jgi:hypothetical protein
MFCFETFKIYMSAICYWASIFFILIVEHVNMRIYVERLFYIQWYVECMLLI